MGATFYPDPEPRHDCQLHIHDASNPDSADGDASPVALTFSQDGDEAALLRVAFWNTERDTAYRASLTFKDVGEWVDWATAVLAAGTTAFAKLGRPDPDGMEAKGHVAEEAVAEKLGTPLPVDVTDPDNPSMVVDLPPVFPWGG